MLKRSALSNIPFEEYRDALVANCGALTLEPASNRDEVKGQVTSFMAADFDIGNLACDLKTVSRTRQDISRSTQAYYFLILQEEGRAMMRQGHEVNVLGPGDMVLINSERPFEFSYFGQLGRQLSVHIPAENIHEQLGTDALGGSGLSRNASLAIALRSALKSSIESPCAAGSYQQAMFGLLAAWMHQARDIPTSKIEAEMGIAGLLSRAIAYFDAAANDPALTIKRVVEDLETSARQLQRAFALIDTTPSEYLQSQRLTFAASLLQSKGCDASSKLVSTIAYHSGFNDVSYFNRLFRRAYGCAPGKYRARYQ